MRPKHWHDRIPARRQPRCLQRFMAAATMLCASWLRRPLTRGSRAPIPRTRHGAMQISDPAVVRSLRDHQSPFSPGFDIAGHHLEIDRHTGRTAHHERPRKEKADTRKPPETLRSSAVDSASKYLTSGRNAAEISAAFTVVSSPCRSGPRRCYQHRCGPRLARFVAHCSALFFRQVASPRSP